MIVLPADPAESGAVLTAVKAFAHAFGGRRCARDQAARGTHKARSGRRNSASIE